MTSQKKNQLKRNERERRRVHQVNDGFDLLRTRLQKPNSNRKLSKADTLREAVKYIRQLQAMLDSTNAYQSNGYNMTHAANYFPVKEELDVYFPSDTGSNSSVSSECQVSTNYPMSASVPFTSPSNSNYSPPQSYYSPNNFHNGMQSSP
ncbi:unnamed protein product [Caenorhabditis bovis]|uniref:BHLH domain-containing protein n=1 Tax=Caenorhabditis bovis TaxID=2654633 RepID=A0A8S1EXL9_9PELO|nr:unnamed protein product [Caenorhabditis bovis]